MVAESDEELMLLKKLEALAHNGVGLKEFCLGRLKDLLGEGGTYAVAYIMGEKTFEDAYLFVLGIKKIFGYGGRDSKAFRGTSR